MAAAALSLQAIEEAIVTASINFLTRRAEAMRVRAVEIDVQRGLKLLRDADALDTCAFDLFDLIPGAERSR